MAEKYPDFYIRKRQKEETYRRIVQLVVGVAVLLVVGGVGGFFIYKYLLQPKRQPAPQVQELADERQELATQNALASAAGQNSAAETAESQPPPAEDVIAKLGDIPYDPSFPAVHVGVEGSNTSVALDGAESEEASEAESESAARDETGAATTPPSQQEQGAAFERNDGAASGAEQPRHDTQQDAEGGQPAQSESAGNDKPATGQDSSPAADNSQADTSAGQQDSGNNVYHVYAGSYATRDEAEKAKNDLQALGFQGQIVDMDIEFHVRVATMDDYEHAKAIRQKLVDSGFPMAFATRSRD